MKGYKFIETLEVTFKKETSNSKTGKHENIYKTAFFNGKAKTITNANEIESELSISQQEILDTIEIWISEGSGWATDKIDSSYVKIFVYQPLNGSSYIYVPDELKNSKKGLINIKKRIKTTNFKWCLVRHLNPQEKDPQKIKKADKKFKTLTSSCTTNRSIKRENTSVCIVCNVLNQKAS